MSKVVKVNIHRTIWGRKLQKEVRLNYTDLFGKVPNVFDLIVYFETRPCTYRTF